MTTWVMKIDNAQCPIKCYCTDLQAYKNMHKKWVCSRYRQPSSHICDTSTQKIPVGQDYLEILSKIYVKYKENNKKNIPSCSHIFRSHSLIFVIGRLVLQLSYIPRHLKFSKTGRHKVGTFCFYMSCIVSWYSVNIHVPSSLCKNCISLCNVILKHALPRGHGG